MKDIISVVVPCYNVEKYIVRCLKSIKNQTYGFENIELILVDDASSDNTLSLLNAFKERYRQNVIVVALQKNEKQGAARNIGMDMATGKYITFVDSDDMIDKTMLEKMHSKMLEFDCDEVRCGMFRFCDDKDISNHKEGLNHRYSDLTNDEERKSYILSSMSCVVPSRLFKREVLVNNNIRFIEGVSYEDAHFSAICCFYVNSRCWLDEELYYYYQNPDSTMSNYSDDKNLEHIIVANRIFDELKERNIYDDVMKRYYHEINAFYFWMIYLNPLTLINENVKKQICYYKNELMANCPDILENAYVTNITNLEFLKAIEFLK